MSYTEERTYKNLIGPLGEAPSVWAECLFADPIADIAVLCEPDGQALFDQCKAYDRLIDHLPGLGMTDPKENTGSAWLLSLESQWIPCDVEHNGGSWYIRNVGKSGIQGGMSGSPILNHDRTAAIGVVCRSSGPYGLDATEGGPNPRLSRDLPAWLAPRPAPIKAPAWKPPQVERQTGLRE
jgi:hypothetical protein